MATKTLHAGNSTEFEGHPSPLRAAAGENARISAILSAIETLAEKLEDCDSQADTFPLATAIQACVESAKRASATAAAGIDVTIEAGEVSHV